ncbi:MAG: sulfotransferase [Actinomycetota bacterium]
MGRTDGSDAVKVLYIMGRGRGGSTILANALGELDGFFSAGEVRSLWDPLVVSDAPCVCGRALELCPVWSHVIEGVDAHQAAVWQREVVKERKLLTLLRQGRASFQPGPPVHAYAGVMGHVYASLASVTGARVIVDSSKRPSYAALLRLIPEISPYYVHLVRDPRASAFSWKHRRYASALPGAEVARRGALDSTLRWNALNLEAEMFRLSSERVPFMTLPFEEFIDAPRTTIGRLTSFVAESVAESPFVDEHSIRLGTNHSLAGNPSRFSRGVVEIRDTGDWQTSQTRFDRWVASTVAAPLLLRYGYSFRSPRSDQ